MYLHNVLMVYTIGYVLTIQITITIFHAQINVMI